MDETTSGTKRKFLSVLFDCCNTYSRIYMHADGTRYVGRCPRCLREVTARVGPGGTNDRVFRAQ